MFKHVGTDNGDTAAREREAKLGCAPAYKLHELIKINKKDGVEYPRTYTDKKKKIDVSHLPKGVEIGFKYGPFDSIVWGHPTDDWLQEI